MLLILEGSDGSGKSTLASQLEGLGWMTFHHGPYKGRSGRELSQALISSMRPAFEGRNLVLDRCWLSEPIYAQVYRKEASRITPAYRRMLERAALQLEAVVVLCRPPVDRCVEAFLSGRDEMMDTEEQLRGVYAGYQALSTELPVVTYDFTRDTLDGLLARVHGVEYPQAKVVLLGDRVNSRTHAQEKYQVPFVSFTGVGCAEWLADQLEVAGVPEASISWWNAFSKDGHPLAPSLLPDLPVIALGRNASEWCSRHGVGHQSLPHPQVHKRFHHEKPYQLIDAIKEILDGQIKSS